MSVLSQQTVEALHGDVNRFACAEDAFIAVRSATNPAIYTAFDIMASLVKQYEAALVKQKGTITEANAEIERLKRTKDFLRTQLDKAQVDAAILQEEADAAEDKLFELVFAADPNTTATATANAWLDTDVNAEVIDDYDSDSEVVDVKRVVYNGVTYLKEANSNVLYHPGSQVLAGRWNSARGRVDTYPINYHEE